MNMWRRIWEWWCGHPAAEQIGPHGETAPTRPDWTRIASELEVGAQPATSFQNRYPVPKPPAEAGKLAMDSCEAMNGIVGPLYGWANNSLWNQGLGFFGYPYLAELQQIAEYRRAAEIIAQEMTRRWIRLTYTGEDKNAGDRLADLERSMQSFNLQAAFRRAIELDGAFGRGHIMIDTGASSVELAKPFVLDGAKIGVGSLKRFTVVEPMWTYPDRYNSTDPLAPDFYRPQTWIVMDRAVSSTRLLTFIGREVPDILKTAYMFGGLSLSQMGKPYVANWHRTRQSVSDITHSYSVWNLAMDMADTLTDRGAANLRGRVVAFNNLRDNVGVNVTNKDTEELTNVSAALTNLDALQAQAQEQMCSVWAIPRIKFLGMSPEGLSANADGEIRTFYDGIHAQQEKMLRPNLLYCIQVLQLNLFGEIDPHIGFEFEALWQQDDGEIADNLKTQAEADQIWVDVGSISPEEVRNRQARDDNSPYSGINPDDVPEPPEPEDDSDDEPA